MDVDLLIDATERLVDVALKDSGQSQKVARFLLAWANAKKYGGFDPASADMLDSSIRRDIALVLNYLLTVGFVYPADLGFEEYFKEVASLHR